MLVTSTFSVRRDVKYHCPTANGTRIHCSAVVYETNALSSYEFGAVLWWSHNLRMLHWRIHTTMKHLTLCVSILKNIYFMRTDCIGSRQSLFNAPAYQRWGFNSTTTQLYIVVAAIITGRSCRLFIRSLSSKIKPCKWLQIIITRQFK